MSQQPSVLIYTDGACSGNPGSGGWAAFLQSGKKKMELSGGHAHTTNNRMEMQAIIEALKSLKRPCNVEICSDSALIINAFKQGWVENWIERGWKKANKKPVENQDLWKEMLTAINGHNITWTKVKGHSTDELNQLVDRLAVQESKRF